MGDTRDRGAGLEAALACPACGRAGRDGAAFCGGCGAARLQPAESEAAIARYQQVLAGFVASGSLDDREHQQLETLRQRLGVSLATHSRLVAPLAPAAPPPPALQLSVDVATMRHFEAGARCLLRLRLFNDGDLAFERLEIEAALTGAGQAPAAIGTLFPGHAEVVGLSIVPAEPGFHELAGVVRAVDLMGEHVTFRFDSVHFRVGVPGDGPRVQVVNIDQSSARVVDNSRSAFGAGALAPAGGGLAPEAEWHPVPLRVVRPQAPQSGASASTPPVAPASSNPRRVSFAVTTERATYQVTTTLAEGDLATVYGGHALAPDASAVAPAAAAKVAVKVAYEARDNDLMQNEVRALNLLRTQPSPQHKHLPVALDQFRTPDGRLGTVFEHVDGFDLLAVRDKLPDGVPPRHLIWLMRRCLSTLGWAHAQGVLHGNLDPSHIMVRPHDHNVWLVDWCWAIVEPARTGQGFRALNPDYGPPEAARRKPPLPSSDLYALGKCMIFAAGGDPATKTLPEGLDDRLARVLRFMVVDSPLGRAQDAWQLYRELDRVREAIWGPHTFVDFKL